MTHHISKSQLEAFSMGYKVNLINSLPGVKSVNLIGTKSESGHENVAIFSTVIHIGSNPALLGFIHRPIGEYGHTLKNILATNYYTINNVPIDITNKADSTSAKLAQDQSEFDYSGLTPMFESEFYAPYVAECPVRIGLALREVHPLLNGTSLVIGEVVEVHINENILTEDGTIDISKSKIAGVIAVATYCSVI